MDGSIVMTTIVEILAARIAQSRYEQISGPALLQAKMGLLDTLGVGIAGSREPAAVIAGRVLSGCTGPATVWGTGRRLPPLEAAYVNGIAANVLDFDDCTDNLGGHPSSPVLPAVLALAQQYGASGRQILLAYVVGFEVETQLGRGVNFHHYEKGWHATSTLGVFAAGAACAKLLDLDVPRIAHTLSLCASLASGIKANLGAMAKPMHIGQSARNGLLAALLAKDGFSGQPDAFEHPHGFLNVYNGPGSYDIARIVEKWGTPWDIEFPGIAIKQYPCCLSTQSVIDLALQLMSRHGIDAARVHSVEARISARRLAHTDRPRPEGPLEAKLSIQYVLARAILDGGVRLEHFSEENWREDRIAGFMTRIDVAAFSEDAGEPDMGAHLTLKLEDGKTVSGRIDRPDGHTPGVPLNAEKLKQKFNHCVNGILGERRTEHLFEAVQAIDTAPDADAIAALLSDRAT